MKLIKKLIRILLWAFFVLLAFLACYPVVFLFTGSLMGTDELKDSLRPVLAGTGGYVKWRLIPLYPTLRAYVELLIDRKSVV